MAALIGVQGWVLSVGLRFKVLMAAPPSLIVSGLIPSFLEVHGYPREFWSCQRRLEA